MQNKSRLILYFDGECILCNRCVQWIHRFDWSNRIYFATLQSRLGTVIQEKLGIIEPLSTVVYSKNLKLYQKSDAVIFCISDLGIFWKPMLLLLVIPKPIRDWIYDFIARKRKIIFSNQACPIPEAKLKKKILEE